MSYISEAQAQVKRLDEMVAGGADAHDVRKQKEVLAEILKQFPDARLRANAGLEDLEQLLVREPSSPTHATNAAKNTICMLSCPTLPTQIPPPLTHIAPSAALVSNLLQRATRRSWRRPARSSPSSSPDLTRKPVRRASTVRCS